MDDRHVGANVVACDVGSAGSGRKEACEERDHCGLACTVRTKQTKAFTGSEGGDDERRER